MSKGYIADSLWNCGRRDKLSAEDIEFIVRNHASIKIRKEARKMARLPRVEQELIRRKAQHDECKKTLHRERQARKKLDVRVKKLQERIFILEQRISDAKDAILGIK